MKIVNKLLLLIGILGLGGFLGSFTLGMIVIDGDLAMKIGSYSLLIMIVVYIIAVICDLVFDLNKEPTNDH